jgi:hypothetical protein
MSKFAGPWFFKDTPSQASAQSALGLGALAYLGTLPTTPYQYSDAAITGAGTTNVNLLANPTYSQVSQFDIGAGGGAYSATINLQTTNAATGARLMILLNFTTTSPNPTITITGANQTVVQTSISALYQTSIEYVYSGTQWLYLRQV